MAWAPPVRINAVSRGPIGETEDMKRLAQERGLEPLVQATSAGRLGRIQEVADACLFLARPAGPSITGACLLVDGGQHAMGRFGGLLQAMKQKGGSGAVPDPRATPSMTPRGSDGRDSNRSTRELNSGHPAWLPMPRIMHAILFALVASFVMPTASAQPVHQAFIPSADPATAGADGTQQGECIFNIAPFDTRCTFSLTFQGPSAVSWSIDGLVAFQGRYTVSVTGPNYSLVTYCDGVSTLTQTIQFCDSSGGSGYATVGDPIVFDLRITGDAATGAAASTGDWNFQGSLS